MKHKMEELSIEITYKCPMECLHCSSRASLSNETYIPKEKIFEMIDKCKEHCGTTDVSLSGGEPFEHPDFWEILEYIKKKELRSIVYSCGVQAKKDTNYTHYSHFDYHRLDKLRNLCDVLIISLHGVQETHNKILNINKNAFEFATKTIKDAIWFGIPVEIHFVPTKINYKEIKIIYGVCLALGVRKMSILRYVPQGRGLETSKNGEINLKKLEFVELQREMKYIKELSEKTNTQFRIGIPADFTFLVDFIDNCNINAKKPKACTGGKTKILVKADGLVQVCPAWKELDHLSAGNIYTEDIVEIWEKGKTYTEFRKFLYTDLEEPCKSCMFVECCLGGCGAQRILNTTMNIDGLKKSPDPLCFIVNNENQIMYKNQKNEKNT